MIPTLIAAGQIGQRPEYSLSEQEYFDKYGLQSAMDLRAEALGAAGAGKRGAEATQGQLISTQLGGGDSSMGEAAMTGMGPSFRRATAHALSSAEQSADEMTRRLMMERQRKRALGAAHLTAVNVADTTAASFVPYVGQYLGAATGFTGGMGQLGLQSRGRGTGQPLETPSFDLGGSEATGAPRVSPGGGGLYDLYNLTYG